MKPYNPEERCPKCGGAFDVRWEEAYKPSPLAWKGSDQPRPERLRCTCKTCGFVGYRAPLDQGGTP